jgi:thiosulfate dehydrogenase [quinone] large subunit
MNNSKAITVAATVVRLLLGWFMFVDGLQILLTPNWSARGFLLTAKTFPAFYAWFALPMNSWWVDPLNSWGITIVGVALLLGIGVRPAAWAGAALMILYYFPHYQFPNVPHGFIVEEHIIDAAVFVLLALLPAAQSFGVSKYLQKTSLAKIPVVGKLL